MDITNKVEFRIVSLARSGHHGIINWIIGQCPGKVCYLNGVKPNRNPYLTYVNKDLKNIGENEFLADEKKENKILKKDYLIYSYEELPLKEVFSKGFESNHDKYLGKSSKRFDILILRDVYNYFASRSKLEGLGIYDPNIRIKLANNSARDALIKLWNNYAEEYIGNTNYLKNNKVVISFNDWVSSKPYREKLAKKLNLKFSDNMMNKMTRAGPGSSFDKLKYADDAGKMKVLERWKVMKDYPFYRDIFKNEEIIGISDKIFGKIEGSNVLFEKQNSIIRIFYMIKFKISLIKGRLLFYLKKILYPLKDRLLRKEKTE